MAVLHSVIRTQLDSSKPENAKVNEAASLFSQLASE
jgi:hypothetical protein